MIWTALASLAVSAGAAASANTRAVSTESFAPLDRYGTEILFDVLRDGSPVGSHRVTFARDAEGLTVKSQFQLELDFLFFTAYRYSYRSQARWLNDQLVSLKVHVNDDGAASNLQASSGTDGLTVEHAERRYTIKQPIYPTNHWHPGVISEARVLNTLTGRINDVTIRPQGRQLVPTESGDIMAMRFVYSGDLQNEVWYDDAGRWVKMRFLGRDGSTIEYVCRRCQGRDAKQAQR